LLSRYLVIDDRSEPFPKEVLSSSGQARGVSPIASTVKETLAFTLILDAWTTSFTNQINLEHHSQRVYRRIDQLEPEFFEIRQKEEISLPSASQMLKEPIDTPYAPKTGGRRLW
jgi:hypothetical protein